MSAASVDESPAVDIDGVGCYIQFNIGQHHNNTRLKYIRVLYLQRDTA